MRRATRGCGGTLMARDNLARLPEPEFLISAIDREWAFLHEGCEASAYFSVTVQALVPPDSYPFPVKCYQRTDKQPT